MPKTININLAKDREKIANAIKEIVDPIARTMSPRGGNVLFRREDGVPTITNDGATIAKYIQPKDPLKRLIVDTLIQSSHQTDKTAGDATSTTILLNGTILNLFIKLNQEEGVTQFEFIESLREVREHIIKSLNEQKLGGEGLDSNMDDVSRVAYVSANNQKDIADIAVEAAKGAGDYGIIKYARSNDGKDSVKTEAGFIIPSAVSDTIFLNKNNSLQYEDMVVFVTDSKVFYQEELNNVLENLTNYETDNILIVAREFSAKIPEVIYNVHSSNGNPINILPIAVDNKELIHDFAAYVGVPVYTESKGKIKDDLADYTVEGVSAGGTMQFVVVQSKNNNKLREERVDLIKSLLEDSPDDDFLKSRLASMTSGVVTVSVGGNTDIEKTERTLKLQDSVLATQKAMTFGYVPGAGTTMLKAARDIKLESELSNKILSEIGQANARQIAHNSGLEYAFDPSLIEDYQGINAMTLQLEDIQKAGIFDSFTAVEQSFLNAVSTSIALISAMTNTIIINEQE